MKLKTAQILILVCSILLSGCVFTPEPTPQVAPVVGSVIPYGQAEVKDLSPTTETVPNCGGGNSTIVKHPSMTVLTSHAVEWEVGGQTGFGVTVGKGVVPGGVDLTGSLETHLAKTNESGINQSTAWDLPAEPNSIMEYTLMWREIWQPGYVDVTLADQSILRINVKYRTGIQSDIIGQRKLDCTSGQAVSTQVVSIPTENSWTYSTYCYGNCWQYDTNARTMTWTGPTDGTEDIWQPQGEPLQNIRNGYIAIITTTVPGEIFSCILTVNGQPVQNSCGLYKISAGTYEITSSNSSIGGFRWCPAIGYGWRVNGGECR